MGRLLYHLARPEIRRRLNGTKRVRVLITVGSEVLLVKGWLSRQRWMLPGGGVEQGESIIEAAQRELVEELGLELTAADFDTIGEFDYEDDYKLKWRACLLSVELSTKPTIKRRRLELSDASWASIDDLPVQCSPLVNQALDGLAKTRNQVILKR